MKKKVMKGSTMLTPVPVVLASVINGEGKHNVITIAWTGVVCSDPAMVYISVRPERLSYEYLNETQDFVLNLPTKSMAKYVDLCGCRSGRVLDKVTKCKFTMKPARHVQSHLIDECPINLECKVKKVLKLGSHDMFLAEVVAVHVAEDLFDAKQKIHFDWAELMVTSHGEYFQLNKKRLGSFGYSVAKNRALVKKSKEENKIRKNKIKK